MKLIPLLFCSLLFTGCAVIRDQVQSQNSPKILAEERLEQTIQNVKNEWGVKQVGIGYPDEMSSNLYFDRQIAGSRARVDYMERVLHKHSATLIGIGVDYVFDDNNKLYAAVAFDMKKKLFSKRKTSQK